MHPDGLLKVDHAMDTAGTLLPEGGVHASHLCTPDSSFCFLQTSVENYRNYRHVTWYTLFIVLYMLVLYFQVWHAEHMASLSRVNTIMQNVVLQGTVGTL